MREAMLPRPVPYPADTSAKGWRFELDYEQIDQSDTWDLAAEIPMGQPALLMMWLVAWRQKPCGSLPADESVIRSKCRIPASTWAKCRGVCMRGWWLGEDGRLYHDTIVKRVESMLAKRAKDAKRTADRREREANKGKTPPGDTGVSRVTPTGLHGEFDTKHQAPSSSVPIGTDAADATSPPDKSGQKPKDPETRQLWADALALVMGVDKVAESTARSFFGQLRRDYPEVIREAVDAAVKAAAKEELVGDVRAYLTATCKRLAGERNTVPSDAADKTKAAQLAEERRFAAEDKGAIALAAAAARATLGLKPKTEPKEGAHVDA